MPELLADTAPAKLLLFGEHTVLHGSGAYAVPLGAFNMALSLGGRSSDPGPFERWLDYSLRDGVLRSRLDLEAWSREAGELSVSSTIPEGYGLGSSGALTALVYRRYARGGKRGDLREILGRLEGYFHGDSSGLDPLVSHLARPVRMYPDGRAEAADLAEAGLPQFAPGGRWFLLDSGRSRAGRGAIARFRESAADVAWRRRYLRPMREVVDELIAGVATGSPGGLTPKLESLSRLQLDGLDFLIPEPVGERWRRWLADGVACLKLCGAGGGGYFLGYADAGTPLDAGRLTLRWL